MTAQLCLHFVSFLLLSLARVPRTQKNNKTAMLLG